MTENPRIEELRRRVQRDKASIAFAQLAEEYRRAGRLEEAIDTCRTGLAHHPGYLSAHVTLGRALLEQGELQSAQDELGCVLAAAPDNLAAIRGLAEIHHRRGERAEALALYRRALEFAPHDSDLERLVGQISRELAPAQSAPAASNGLSFEEAVGEFLALDARSAATPAGPGPAPEVVLESVPEPVAPAELPPPRPAEHQPPVADSSASPPAPAPAPEPPTASMQVEALERWLDAILADRVQRG